MGHIFSPAKSLFGLWSLYPKNIPKDCFLHKVMTEKAKHKINFSSFQGILIHHLLFFSNMGVYKFLFKLYKRIMTKTEKGKLTL